LFVGIEILRLDSCKAFSSLPFSLNKTFPWRNSIYTGQYYNIISKYIHKDISRIGLRELIQYNIITWCNDFFRGWHTDLLCLLDLIICCFFITNRNILYIV
jgi:hypothetical protein